MPGQRLRPLAPRLVMGTPDPDKTEPDFLRRYQALPPHLKQYISCLTRAGAEVARLWTEELHLGDFETALTVYQAIWTYGAVRHVEPHWQPSYWFISDDDKATLTRFMEKQCRTADFAHPIGRSYLLHRFDRALKCMLADQTTFDQVMSIVRDAVSDCADRVTYAFNHIDTAVRVQEIYEGVADFKNITWELTHYGLSLLRLEAVRKYATAYCIRNRIRDKVEVHLNFEILLKESLNLPIASGRSLYGDKFPIPVFHLEAAAQMARQKASDPACRHAFFAAWSPWIMHQRQLTAQSTTYASLPLVDSDFADVDWITLRCAITQEPLDVLTEPVFIGEGNQIRVYEYADLLVWWIRNGHEPSTRQPLKLESLYRVEF